MNRLFVPLLLSLSFAGLVQGLEAYKVDVHRRKVHRHHVVTQHKIEPPPSCTGECADGYRWASENAVNEESQCPRGNAMFSCGCKELVQDEVWSRL